MTIRRINVDGLGRLPAFSHASVAGDWIFVSGTLGTEEDSFRLVPGGTGPETARTLHNIGRILEAAGAGWPDVVKVNVFLADMEQFAAMNEAYLGSLRDVLGGADPPARITVGRAGLALGAAVEIDCVAWRPASG